MTFLLFSIAGWSLTEPSLCLCVTFRAAVLISAVCSAGRRDRLLHVDASVVLQLKPLRGHTLPFVHSLLHGLVVGPYLLQYLLGPSLSFFLLLGPTGAAGRFLRALRILTVLKPSFVCGDLNQRRGRGRWPVARQWEGSRWASPAQESAASWQCVIPGPVRVGRRRVPAGRPFTGGSCHFNTEKCTRMTNCGQDALRSCEAPRLGLYCVLFF